MYSNSKNKLYLCIGGPLDKQRTSSEIANKYDYVGYNCSGKTKNKTQIKRIIKNNNYKNEVRICVLPSYVFIHKSLFEITVGEFLCL